MRNPGFEVKCAWNGNVPSKVSPARMPPTRGTLLARRVGFQDLLEKKGEEKRDRDVTIINSSCHLASKNRQPVLHGVDVHPELAGNQLEIAPVDKVTLEGWQ